MSKSHPYPYNKKGINNEKYIQNISFVALCYGRVRILRG